MGLFDFWNWLQNGAGQKTVDILSVSHSFFSSRRLAGRCSPVYRKPAGFGYSWPPTTQRPYATLLTLFRNALAVIISTITIILCCRKSALISRHCWQVPGHWSGYLFWFANAGERYYHRGIIQFENGMNTGDLVTIGPLTGLWNGCRFAPWACARIPGRINHSVVFDNHLC